MDITCDHPVVSPSSGDQQIPTMQESERDSGFQATVPDPLSSINRIPNTAYMHTDEGVTASIDNLSHGNPWNTLQNDSPSSDASIFTDSAPSYTSATCEVENSVSDKFLHSFDLREPGAGDQKNLTCSPPVMNSNELGTNSTVQLHVPLRSPCPSPLSTKASARHQSLHYPSSPCSSIPSSSPPQIFSSSPPSTTGWSHATLSDDLYPDCPVDECTTSGGPSCSPPAKIKIPSIDVSDCNMGDDAEPVITDGDEEKTRTELETGNNETGLTANPSNTSIKRKRSLESMGPPSTRPRLVLGGDAPSQKIESRRAIDEPATHPVPANKRPTAAFQKLLNKKLASPFRPPAMKAPSHTQGEPSESSKGGKSIKHEVDKSVAATRPAPAPSLAPRVGTKRAAAQFKSPLVAGARDTTFAVRLTPIVQALQRDVQILKRAVKVKQEGEEDELERLVRKWTEAGREVAYELWGLVKGNESGDRSANIGLLGKGEGRFEGSWGWEGNKASRDRSWGFGDATQMELEDASNDLEQQTEAEGRDVQEEDVTSDTLGTMLRQLGIAPETLGWDEEEEMFIGE